jgi:hypothetical protein
MDHSLREALNLGLVRQNQKNIGDVLFKNLRDTANDSILKNARYNRGKGGNFGIANYNTGVVSVSGSFPETMGEIQKIESRQNIVEKLTRGTDIDKSKIIENDERFFSNNWFQINANNKKPSWDKALEQNQTLNLTSPSGKKIRGIPFGNEETGLSVLFRIDKTKELI